jgi:hypothetical protein
MSATVRMIKLMLWWRAKVRDAVGEVAHSSELDAHRSAAIHRNQSIAIISEGVEMQAKADPLATDHSPVQVMGLSKNSCNWQMSIRVVSTQDYGGDVIRDVYEWTPLAIFPCSQSINIMKDPSILLFVLPVYVLNKEQIPREPRGVISDAHANVMVWSENYGACGWIFAGGFHIINPSIVYP